MSKQQRRGTARRLALLIAVVAVLAAAIFIAPQVRAKIVHVFGPYYWEFKYYYLTYRQVGPAEAGDGGLPSEILLQDPMGIDLDEAGNVYVSDRARLIWKIVPGEAATVIGGTGQRGFSRDGVPAVEAGLGLPEGLSVDADGRVYFADSLNNVVMRIDRDGTIARVAGTGEKGFSGDGGPAVEAALNRPFDVRVDDEGTLYIADRSNHRVRKVTRDGLIDTVAGNGKPGYGGDGGNARLAQLNEPYGVYPRVGGGVLIADSRNNVIRLVDADGIITTIAGTGERGFAGDGGPASAAKLDVPQSLYSSRDGRIYINDEHNHAIRVIDRDGRISTAAGTGNKGWADDGMPGPKAPLHDPENVAVRGDGSMLITDGDNGRVVLVRPDGTLHHFAGRRFEN